MKLPTVKFRLVSPRFTEVMLPVRLPFRANAPFVATVRGTTLLGKSDGPLMLKRAVRLSPQLSVEVRCGTILD